MKTILLLFISVISHQVVSQTIEIIGAGNHEDIVVSSSDESSGTLARNTINGSGMMVPRYEVSRFLGQATLGPTNGLIEEVFDLGIEAWIEEQFSGEPAYLTPMVRSIWEERRQWRINAGEDPDDIFGPWGVDFNYAWWQTIMTTEDHLRHKVALALSEILVVSIFSDLGDRAYALSDYYDMLLENSFGNYRDLLGDVTRHVAMGHYLSHMNNPKSNPEENQRPDENYARELMQLFTIGLYELNQDGSLKTSGGQPIPTYDNNDIPEFAKIFTGFGPGEINDNVDWTDVPRFGMGLWGTDATVPMAMYEDYHEPDEKKLLNGFVVQAGNSGERDVDIALDHLFNHPNVGPFIAYRLIQRLVKSNPSRGYVRRVAGAFNGENGGRRGDMKNVIRAILLDDEARSSDQISMSTSSRMREPIVKYAHTARALTLDSPYGRYWNNGYNAINNLKQHPLASPSVFNFFTPDHAPVGPIFDQGNVAPEFKLHDTSTAIKYINRVNSWLVWWAIMNSWEGDYGDEPIFVDFEEYREIAEDPVELINKYDLLFTHGQLTDRTRDFIIEAIKEITWGEYQIKRAEIGLYLVLVSPDYNLVK